MVTMPTKDGVLIRLEKTAIMAKELLYLFEFDESVKPTNEKILNSLVVVMAQNIAISDALHMLVGRIPPS